MGAEEGQTVSENALEVVRERCEAATGPAARGFAPEVAWFAAGLLEVIEGEWPSWMPRAQR